MPRSNTAGNSRKTNGKPFTKGDPRINRKGRPKSFDALRSLAQGISHEAATSNGEPLVIDGHIATVAEVIMRQWAKSKDPRLQMAFIEICYGKVPNETKVSGAIEVNADADAILSKLLPELADRDAENAPEPTE